MKLHTFWRRLNCFATAFAGADANAIIHRKDENLSIANFTGLSGSATFQDRVNRGLNERLIDRDLELNLAKQIHAEFMPTVDARLPLLATKALAIHDGQPKNLDLRQRFFYGF